MQFKDLEQLKEFLLWAKSQKISAISIGDVTINFSEMNFIPGIEQTDLLPSMEPANREPDPDIPTYTANSKTWADSDQSKDDEEALLMWSTNS